MAIKCPLFSMPLSLPPHSPPRLVLPILAERKTPSNLVQQHKHTVISNGTSDVFVFSIHSDEPVGLCREKSLFDLGHYIVLSVATELPVLSAPLLEKASANASRECKNNNILFVFT